MPVYMLLTADRYDLTLNTKKSSICKKTADGAFYLAFIREVRRWIRPAEF